MSEKSSIRHLLEDATDGVCYNSHRYCADEELKLPTINYDEQQFTLSQNRYGETDHSLEKTKDLSRLARQISQHKPIFHYFLDGSRRTYKVDDLEINKRIFPIMAGQISVGCCQRRSNEDFGCQDIENNLVLSLPAEANPDARNSSLFFNNLTSQINSVDRVKRCGLKFSNILAYPSRSNQDNFELKYEHLGIVAIQEEMIANEKRIVAGLASRNLLSEESFLLKDGSLQYKPTKSADYKELTKVKNNYRWVIGASKLFNPEFSKDRNGRSNAAALAKLPKFHRTPAFMFQHDREKWAYLGDYKYGVWYVRIRDSHYTESPFAGILKLEKILITDAENETGVDSDLIDIITANVINERNPVCYGRDSRWANHLYPIYLTELFLKSKFLSDIHFLNLF